MWVFLCFGFTHGRLVNCFYLSIPFCGRDIPVALVDVGPKRRLLAARWSLATEGRGPRPVTNEGNWTLLSE
jgi:hypothetical protein